VYAEASPTKNLDFLELRELNLESGKFDFRMLGIGRRRSSVFCRTVAIRCQGRAQRWIRNVGLLFDRTGCSQAVQVFLNGSEELTKAVWLTQGVGCGRSAVLTNWE
jgi:hypothetical protein